MSQVKSVKTKRDVWGAGWVDGEKVFVNLEVPKDKSFQYESGV